MRQCNANEILAMKMHFMVKLLKSIPVIALVVGRLFGQLAINLISKIEHFSSSLKGSISFIHSH